MTRTIHDDVLTEVLDGPAVEALLGISTGVGAATTPASPSRERRPRADEVELPGGE